LPTQQSDYPTRLHIPAAALHGRREASFLALAGIFLLGIVSLPLLGGSKIIDVAARVPDLELPIGLALPVGALAFPLSFLALHVVCELYGPRRAGAMAMFSLVAGLAAVGLLRAAEAIPGRQAGAGPAGFLPGVALAACASVASWLDVLVFGVLRARMRRRRLWLRHSLATLIAQVGGWGTFSLVSYGLAEAVGVRARDVAGELDVPIALAGAAYTLVAALIGTLLLYPAVSGLGVFLRIARLALQETSERGSSPKSEGERSYTPPTGTTVELEAGDLVKLGVDDGWKG
jgi:uncharacterized integral membrane protein (TIGR00697 family)